MSFSMFLGHDLLTYQLIQFLSTLLNLPISGAGTSQLFYCAFERLVFKIKANKTTVQPKGDCCHAGRQEVSRCCTRGVSEESIVHRQWRMQASGSILVRNPGQTSLVFSNRGISGLRKMADVLQIFFKKTGLGEGRGFRLCRKTFNETTKRKRYLSRSIALLSLTIVHFSVVYELYIDVMSATIIITWLKMSIL